ncbi:hypothetical protein D3C71_1590330 [compost metagenome]
MDEQPPLPDSPAVRRSLVDLLAEEVGIPVEIGNQNAALVQFAFVGGFLGSEIGKGHACLGVDFQAPYLAPVLELLRPDHCPDDMPPRAALLLLSSGGGMEPFGMGVVQGVAICHEALDLLEVFF